MPPAAAVLFYPRIRELMKDMVGESFEKHSVARFEALVTGTSQDPRCLAVGRLTPRSSESAA